MAEAATQRSLVKKLAEVMAAVGYVQKRGRNTFHNYTYATEADIADKVREELAKRSVVVLPFVAEHAIRNITTRKGNEEFIVTAVCDFTFHDGDSGESLTVRIVGEGQDGGDKGIYKALTGAAKYMMMKSFLISTGDDPERDADEESETPSQLATQSAEKPGGAATQGPAPTNTMADKAAEVFGGKRTGKKNGKGIDFTAFYRAAGKLGYTPQQAQGFANADITAYTQEQLDNLLADLQAVRAKEAAGNA